jgi:hypothetical protein
MTSSRKDKPRRFVSREDIPDILNAPKADPNDPAQIAPRAKEAEEIAYFNSLTSKCLEAGRQLADKGEADFSFAPPGVLYDVTDGKAGTPGRSEAAGAIFMLSTIVRIEYKRRFAERYLEDTGLAPGVAARAHTMDSPDAGRLMDWSRLTKEEASEYRQALGTLERLNLLWQQALGMALTEEPKPPGTAEEMKAAEAIIERSRFTAEDADGKEVTTLVVSGGARSGHLEMPGAKEAAAIVEALQSKAVLPVEHYAQERAKLLTDSAGELQLSPREWLTAQGQESALEALGFGLERLDSERQLEEANRRADEEKRAKEAAESQLARMRGDRTLLPRALHDGWRPTTDKDGKSKQLSRLEAMQRGEIVPENESTTEILSRAAVRQVDAREFADLTVPQIRALVGVCSLITDAGETDEGQRFVKSPTFTARQLYEAAGVNARQPKQCRDTYHALVELAERRVFLEVLNPADSETGKPTLSMLEGPMFTLVAHFAGDDPQLFGKWTAWRKKHNRGAWTGPLPVRYTLTLSNAVRQTFSPLVLSRDTLERLEAGAKKVRDNGKLTPLDWALFMELTFTRQSQQIEIFSASGNPDIVSVRSYVERRSFLRDYHGAAALKKDPARLDRQYETSAEVLKAGGLVLKATFGQKGRRGARDIFVPNPAVLLGVGPRAERAHEIQEAQEEARKQTVRKKARARSARKTGKGGT